MSRKPEEIFKGLQELMGELYNTPEYIMGLVVCDGKVQPLTVVDMSDEGEILVFGDDTPDKAVLVNDYLRNLVKTMETCDCDHEVIDVEDEE